MDWLKYLVDLANPLINNAIPAVIVGLLGAVFFHRQIGNRLKGIERGDPSSLLAFATTWFVWALLSAALGKLFEFTGVWYVEAVRGINDRLLFIRSHFEDHPLVFLTVFVLLMLATILWWFIKGQKLVKILDWDWIFFPGLLFSLWTISNITAFFVYVFDQIQKAL